MVFAGAPELSVPTNLTGEVELALKRLDATNIDDDWCFTMQVVEAAETSVIHSDPSRGKYDRRQLVSVNGVEVDEEQLKAFRGKEVERIDAMDPNDSGYGYLVDIQSLQPLDTDDGSVQYSFIPRVKDLGDSRDKIRGTLRLDPSSQQIEQISIHNLDELNPVFSVSVDTYLLTLQFKQEQGHQLLNHLESLAVGKAGFVKSFESHVVVSFSEYRRCESVNQR